MSTIQEKVELIVSTGESLVISNNEELTNATNFIKEIKSAMKIVEAHYEPMVSSAKMAYDTARNERDKFLKPLKDIEDKVKKMMNEYNNKLLALQREEERKKRELEEEQRKKMAEVSEAIRNGDSEAAKARMEEALSSTVFISEIEKPQVAGMSTRTLYKVKVIDLEKVPHKVGIMPILGVTSEGEKWLIEEYKKAKAMGTEFKVDGLEVVEEVTTVIR